MSLARFLQSRKVEDQSFEDGSENMDSQNFDCYGSDDERSLGSRVTLSESVSRKCLPGCVCWGNSRSF